jgi:hypothetical protein
VDLIDLVVRAVVLSGALPLAAFIYFYSTEPHGPRWWQRHYSTLWRSTPIGVTLMYQKIAMLTLILLVAASMFLGDYPGRDFIRVIVYVAVVSLFWRVLFTLRRIQKQSEKE